MHNVHYRLDTKRLATWVVLIAAIVIVYSATMASRQSAERAQQMTVTNEQNRSSGSPAAGTDSLDTPVPSNPVKPSPGVADPAPAGSAYKDGSYTTTVNYRTPKGSEYITVTLTLAAGKIADSNIGLSNQEFETRRYQGQFADGYKAVVVGQPIAGLELRRVSGASLTTAAFNNALDTVRSQARS